MSVTDGFHLWLGARLADLSIFLALVALGAAGMTVFYVVLWAGKWTQKVRAWHTTRHTRLNTYRQHKRCRARLAELLPNLEQAKHAYLNILLEERLTYMDGQAAAELEASHWTPAPAQEPFMRTMDWAWMALSMACMLAFIGWAVWMSVPRH